MEELNTEDRFFLEGLLRYSKRIHNGYYFFQPRNKKYGNKKYKEHRVLIQLALNKKLTIHDIVHHIDGNRLNNSINNLEITTAEKHSSHHHAGKRK